ncbi:LMBR1-like membrane protein [Artemisia annua]|uniref:LMBR1-like membrane protein n=1 Tax=Artemisia annua TaxID=35608 RepID=A0A2U1NJX8_ARTAN|nr:LMBR1-like membrane protein [Artemisia annua]
MGMVMFTLRYFAGPDVPRHILFTVGYTWFCSLSFIILVPADIWTAISDHNNGGISFFWSWSYWSTFLLTWAVVPILQGYEDAGDFTVKERLKTSIHVNLVFYLIVGAVAFCGLILLILLHRNWLVSAFLVQLLATAVSNWVFDCTITSDNQLPYAVDLETL